MLYTRRGWQDVTGDEGWKSTMVVFMAKEDDAWAEITGLLPKIQAVIEKYALTGKAGISYGAGMLSITLHAEQHKAIPEIYRQAGEELLQVVAPKNDIPPLK